MTIKEKTLEFINSDSLVSEIYKSNGGFKNVIYPVIKDTEDDDQVLYSLITMLALQSTIYDGVLDVVAEFGNKELTEKCRNVVMDITGVNE